MRHFFSVTVKPQRVPNDADAPAIFQLLDDPVLDMTGILYAEVVDSQRPNRIDRLLSRLGNRQTGFQVAPLPWPALIFPLILLIVFLLTSSN
jgi:hypothetical protein